MSGNLAYCGGVQRFLLLSNTTADFLNVQGTYHLSQHGAPLWFAVRFSRLQSDNPSMKHARGIPFQHLGHTTQMLSGQSAQPPARFLNTIQSPYTTGVALLQAYSFVTQTCTGQFELGRSQEFQRTFFKLNLEAIYQVSFHTRGYVSVLGS